MDFLKHHNDTTSWEELQEPVPFEDFKFSFGLDPDLSIPLPLDPNLTTTSTSIASPFDITTNTSSSADPMLSEEIFPFDSYLTHSTNNQISSVLNEQDQKTFSNFLDTFFMDQLPTHSTAFDTSSTTTSSNGPLQFMSPLTTNPPPPPLSPSLHDEDVEEQRRNSILQSLDHQKQKLHERLNFLASTNKPKSTSTSDRRTSSTIPSSSTTTTTTNRKRSSSIISYDTTTSNSSIKKTKHDHHHHHHHHQHHHHQHHHKELLTEEEKRANHIASEQKRRSTIRMGFKDLTDIIPTLKNINNSKSTVLFKAVDFIKYLDRRNKIRREKLHQLELRLKVQGKMSPTPTRSLPPLSNHTSPTSSSSSPPPLPSSLFLPSSSSAAQKHPPFPPNVSAALMAHKSQQEQLLQLQEQLQLHQQLLARQQEMKENSTFTLAPLRKDSYHQRKKHKSGFRAVRHPSDGDAREDDFLKPTLSA